MTTQLSFQTTNTILYCKAWQATLTFYRQAFALAETFASDWFIEFALSPTARLSIADEARATVKSSAGQGVTLTFQVADVEQAWQTLNECGAMPGKIRRHAWGAQVFYLRDPEGHRLEIWSADSA